MLSFFKRADPQKVAKLVQAEIEANKVVVFSKTYCPYCTQAKQALNAVLGKGKYKVIELDSRSDSVDIQAYMAQITGARTVPRVFIGGKCIGGGSETASLKKSGELQRMLHQLGLI